MSSYHLIQPTLPCLGQRSGCFYWYVHLYFVFQILVENVLNGRQIAIADRQKMEEILGALEDIANLIGRCAIYEALYLGQHTTAARCEEAIVELYVSIFLYLLRAKQYYSKNTAGTSCDCKVRPQLIVTSSSGRGQHI